MAAEEEPKIPLPKAWTSHVRSAVLHVIGLAQFATAYTRSWSANNPNERMRPVLVFSRLRSRRIRDPTRGGFIDPCSLRGRGRLIGVVILTARKCRFSAPTAIAVRDQGLTVI